jgi:hypothetical protein
LRIGGRRENHGSELATTRRLTAVILASTPARLAVRGGLFNVADRRRHGNNGGGFVAMMFMTALRWRSDQLSGTAQGALDAHAKPPF